MERLHFKDIKRYALAAKPYIMYHSEPVFCPDCGHELKVEYRMFSGTNAGSLSISCEACQKLAYIDRALKPEWMD